MLRVQHRRLFQIIWHPFTVFAPIPPSCPSQNVYLNSAWLELQFSVWCLIFCFSSCIPPSILKLFCILSVKMNKFLSRQNIFIPHPAYWKVLSSRIPPSYLLSSHILPNLCWLLDVIPLRWSYNFHWQIIISYWLMQSF